jgi:hypothetical protein
MVGVEEMSPLCQGDFAFLHGDLLLQKIREHSADGVALGRGVDWHEKYALEVRAVAYLLSIIDDLPEVVKQLKDASAIASHPGVLLKPRCDQYWREHANRCLRPEHHDGPCYFMAPAFTLNPALGFHLPGDLK